MGKFPYASIPQAFQADYEVIQFMEAARLLLGQLQIANDQVIWRTGIGSPEGIVAAKQGSLYSRLDGSTTTTLYVKCSGDAATSTGWIAK